MADTSTRYPGVYRRGDRYQVEYQDSLGQRRWKTLPAGTTAKQASEARAALVSKLSRGQKVVGQSKITVEELWREWLPTQTHLKQRTVETYDEAMRLYVRPCCGWRKVSDVDVELVAALVSGLRGQGLAAWTIRRSLTPLSRLMQHAVRRGLASSNPVAELDRSERPKSDQAPIRILTTEEISRLLEASTEAYRPLLTTAVFTGMRIGELLALTWEDIDFEKGEIRVQDSKTKAGRRSVVMVEPVARTLAGLSLRPGSELGRVFPRGHRNVLRSHYATIERAGVQHLRFHDLRHTFASILIHLGYDAAFIADQMGHASIVTTHRIYGHLFDGEGKKEQMRKDFATTFGGVS